MSRLKIITRVPSKEGLDQMSTMDKSRFYACRQNLHHCEAKQLICYKGEEIKAVMPLYEKKRLGLVI